MIFRVVLLSLHKRVKEFMKKTTYEVKPNEGKGFSEIDIKELVRVHEEVEYNARVQSNVLSTSDPLEDLE